MGRSPVETEGGFPNPGNAFVMSLLQRLERSHQEADAHGAAGSCLLPLRRTRHPRRQTRRPARAPLGDHGATRADRLHEIRLQLRDDVIGAFQVALRR